MPASSGSSRRFARWRSQGPLGPSLRSMKAVAAPATRNSSDMRHGALNRIHGSSAALAKGLFTCQPQVT